jgi:hypothetical protein
MHPGELLLLMAFCLMVAAAGIYALLQFATP